MEGNKGNLQVLINYLRSIIDLFQNNFIIQNKIIKNHCISAHFREKTTHLVLLWIANGYCRALNQDLRIELELDSGVKGLGCGNVFKFIYYK